MRWPRLVVPFTQSTRIEAVVDADGIDEDGAPIQGARWSGLCNWQDQTAEVYSKEKASTEVMASLYIDGDPFPRLAIIAGGTVDAFGSEMTIIRGTKGRNPDGTVNFTRLELK